MVGLGLSNRALIRYLLGQGVVPTACDRLGPEELGEPMVNWRPRG